SLSFLSANSLAWASGVSACVSMAMPWCVPCPSWDEGCSVVAAAVTTTISITTQRIPFMMFSPSLAPLLGVQAFHHALLFGTDSWQQPRELSRRVHQFQQRLLALVVRLQKCDVLVSLFQPRPFDVPKVGAICLEALTHHPHPFLRQFELECGNI